MMTPSILVNTDDDFIDFDRCYLVGLARFVLYRRLSPSLRKIAAHQITASDLNTFTNTFLINMRMKFVMTTT